MSEEKKGFIIKDRRIFSGDVQGAEEKGDNKKAAAEEIKSRMTEEKTPSEETQKEYPLPEINFATFIFSLNSSALVHLGVIEDPASGKKVKNLPLAKQTIDILGILAEKTQGNLIKDEENLLKNILHDLRLMYVKEKK